MDLAAAAEQSDRVIDAQDRVVDVRARRCDRGADQRPIAHEQDRPGADSGDDLPTPNFTSRKARGTLLAETAMGYSSFRGGWGSLSSRSPQRMAQRISVSARTGLAQYAQGRARTNQEEISHGTGTVHGIGAALVRVGVIINHRLVFDGGEVPTRHRE